MWCNVIFHKSRSHLLPPKSGRCDSGFAAQACWTKSDRISPVTPRHTLVELITPCFGNNCTHRSLKPWKNSGNMWKLPSTNFFSLLTTWTLRKTLHYSHFLPPTGFSKHQTTILLPKSSQKFPVPNSGLRRHQICVSACLNKAGKDVNTEEKLLWERKTYLRVVQAKLWHKNKEEKNLNKKLRRMWLGNVTMG